MSRRRALARVAASVTAGRGYRGGMQHSTTIVEMCPGCGSLDVLVAEPRWFVIDVERRAVIGADEGWVERLEFGCRDCGTRWD